TCRGRAGWGPSGARSVGASHLAGHIAFRADRPGGIPRDLPGVVVGISEVSPEAAMRWRIGGAQQLAAETQQPVDHRLHLILGADIVGEREGAALRESRSLHVAFQLLL